MSLDIRDPFSDLLDMLSSANFDKYKPFEVINAHYKTLNSGGQRIGTDILIPRTLLAERAHSKCPVIVRIHGGFLVTGSSLYPPWFSDWILEYAIQNGAIIVSPNYRLLPEASGEEILKDMHDFWGWLHSERLGQMISDAGYGYVQPAIDKTLVVGESAGGYLAVQLALSFPSEIRAVIGAYPILDLKAKFYTEAYPKPIIRVPNVPNDILEKHLASLRTSQSPGTVTAADPPERLELAFSIFQNGRLLEFLGSGSPDLYPMERVKRLAAMKRLELPPLFIFHGKQDSAVPVEGSRRFISLLYHEGHDGLVKLHIQDGDHGFDFDATLQTGWLRDGLEMISKAWVGGKKDIHGIPNT